MLSSVRRWLRAGRASRRAAIVYHSAYGTELAISEHDHERAARILTFLLHERLVSRRRIHEPDRGTLSSLRRVHTDEYLESLEQPAALLPIVGFSSSPAQRDTFVEAQRRVVAGTLLAADLAMSRHSITLHLGGGLHHAFPDHGQGFCAFNDVAIAVTHCRGRGFEAPILVIDLDLHDGDGTRAVFRDDDSVHTFSIHNYDLGAREARASTSVALGGGVRDDAYLDAVERHLPPVIEQVRPGLVLYLAGTDPAADDRLGDWKVTGDGLLARDRFVISRVREAGVSVPVVVLLAGGYGRATWRYSARFFAWILSGGEVVEPPDSDEVALSHHRRISRRLRADELARDTGADWALTEDDIMSALSGQARPNWLLDHLSRHAVELALERFGLFDRLRGMGFERLHLELDLADHAGQTLRVFGEPDRSELLVELRVSRDRAAAPAMVLLRVEWLLLQNPRAKFIRGRERLPGQRHPGLGLLKDVVAVLAAWCQRLGLDGMVFSPSHYHLAAQSPKRLRFIDPRVEARFRSMRAALDSLTLVEATRAVEQDRVVDARVGAPVTWCPAPMVLPVSRRLRARMGSAQYEEKVAAARRGMKFELRA